ncbi:ROK family protein [Shinella yambaruensis]|uniref:Sugar kinase n=1 Tax=Shinella yambaruensis TaxID=415996 RepID=A0ABQ5ZQV6_9HYPH|nr:ROK family protein [Shinella yambaruensis]MCJ8029206.1 ROK family protein [Shinella yambaruensis]MCU7983441.1 ROK family protein [Shinella yambaruensis]GLR55058.1 sugar kinase [Shinella yambaruensis]
MVRGDEGHDRTTLDGAGGILSLIATGAAASRAELLAASGLSRVTVTQRLNALLASGLVRETEKTLPSGGRPTRVLAINPASGFLLVANIGETHIHLAAMDLTPAILSQTTLPFSVASGPEATLAQIGDAFAILTAETEKTHGFFLGISLSLPTPVDFKRGCVVGPSVLPGWDEFDIIGRLKARFDVPVYVENDVNLMTICEHKRRVPAVDDMLFVKVGTGMGSGMIAGGRLFRGAQGAAGDIGHIQFLSDDAPLCRCGKFGCVEARAAGWAIARDLSARGFRAETARDVIDLVEQRKPEALMLLRAAGRTIGEVISDVVSIINPSLIVIGGTLARGGDLMLSGIRELVYQRCLPLATRDLSIVLSTVREDGALFGAAHLLLDDLFASAKADRLLERYDFARQRHVPAPKRRQSL